MVFIKKHKYIFIVGFVFLILFVLAIIGLKEILYPNNSKDKYGSRLKGIESVKMTDDIVNNIKEKISKSNGVIGIEYHLSGKIINFIITVKNDVDINESEGFGNKIIELISDEYKNYYDIQLFIKTNEESEIYPMIGYKHKSSITFVWNNIALGGKNE